METHLSHGVMKGGAWVPSVAIFTGKKRSVNVPATVEHVITLALHGAEGVVINGTTGEGHLLSLQDKLRLIEGVGRAKADGRLDSSFVLLTGTGTEQVEEAKEIIALAQKYNFDGALVLPPKEESKKKAFYVELASCCGNNFVLLLYHHPRLDPGFRVSPDLLGDLMADYPSVVGVKDSSGDKALLYQWVTRVKAKCGRAPLVAVGEDFFVKDGLFEAGALAAIAGAANTAEGLAQLKTIFQGFRTHNTDQATQAQAKFDKEITRLLQHGAFRDNAKRYRIRSSVFVSES